MSSASILLLIMDLVHESSILVNIDTHAVKPYCSLRSVKLQCCYKKSNTEDRTPFSIQELFIWEA